jgi:shikimate kinase
MTSAPPPQQPPWRVLLAGLRASGKSTIGPRLAERLFPGAAGAFADLDALTLAELGADSVAQAWARVGQRGFREAEARALMGVLRRDVPPRGLVLALGGGTPTATGVPDLIEAERQRAPLVVVYLHATPALLQARLRRTDLALRPGITGDDPIAEVARLYAERDPLYRRLADVVVEVEGLDAPAAADTVAAAVWPRGR